MAQNFDINTVSVQMTVAPTTVTTVLDPESYDKGYNAGETEGHKTGKAEGYTEGYDKGKSDGYGEGYDKGKSDGYGEGWDIGEKEGYQSGKSDGYAAGYGDGNDAGYIEGEKDGIEAGKNEIISLHPEKTVSGSYISVDDVSELPHDVKCKVTGVANPESVTVTRLSILVVLVLEVVLWRA